MNWQPILTRTTKARAAIDAIRHDLKRPTDPTIPGNLSVGPAGAALFYAYVSKAGLGDEDDARLAHSRLEEAVIRMGESRSPSLNRGFVGVAWAVSHLGADGDEEEEGDFSEIDRLVLERLSTSLWAGHYDLTRGLVGLGVYALERLPRPTARRTLERVLSHLEACATHEPDGTTWYSPHELVSTVELKGFKTKERFCNLGLARGIPGVIALLSRVYDAGIARERVGPLLRESTRWLLAQPQRHGIQVGFPFAVAKGETPSVARVAWCSGDLGISVALLAAARALEDARMEETAVAVARRVAERPRDESEIIDACLCHGAAGAGHIFNRLWQATGEPSLLRAAVSWFEATLEMRRPGMGLGGFLTWERNAWLHGGPDGPKSWVQDPGLHAGAAGTGLALLAAITDVEPQWDRVLLVALKTRARSTSTVALS